MKRVASQTDLRKTFVTISTLQIPKPIFNKITSIRKEIQDNDLILTKADKGNTVVILKRIDYSEKKLEFLSNNNALHDSNFSFSMFNDRVRGTNINSSKLVIPHREKRSLLIPQFGPSQGVLAPLFVGYLPNLHSINH